MITSVPPPEITGYTSRTMSHGKFPILTYYDIILPQNTYSLGGTHMLTHTLKRMHTLTHRHAGWQSFILFTTTVSDND